MEAYGSPQKAQCVFWFNKMKLATVVQCRFCTKFGKGPPTTSLTTLALEDGSTVVARVHGLKDHRT
jgi:hypothetical protein